MSRKRFHRGLVIGKFAPLHRGHELVIHRALEESHEVVLLSWANPELPGCEPENRHRWLEQRFPMTRRLVVTDARLQDAPGELRNWTVPADDCEPELQRRFAALLCRDLLGVTVDAVFTSEAYGDPFALELEKVFREGGRERPVHHVSVDPSRSVVPVSGSALRADIHRNRRWLAPEVYASFVDRVVMLGGESSGKSTLAAALAQRFDTLYTEEYGRQLWEEKDGALSFDDLLFIARRQIELEEMASLGAYRYLFCDTSPLTTLFYSLELFGRADPELCALAERRYDRVVLCTPDFPFVQDGTRREGGFRHQQHEWYVKELSRRGWSWLEVEGSLAQRVEQVARASVRGARHVDALL